MSNLRIRFIIGSAIAAVLVCIVLANWDGAFGQVSVSLLHWRIYCVAVIAFTMVHCLVWVLEPHWRALGMWPISLTLIALSIVIGVAIGTTDWQAWTMSRWGQLAWTLPMTMGSLGQIHRIMLAQSPRKESRSSHLTGESLPDFRRRLLDAKHGPD